MANIAEIKARNCTVYPTKKQDRKGRGAMIVGAYYHPPHHRYLYKAYHVVYNNGEKDTVRCDRVEVEESAGRKQAKREFGIN